MQKKGLDRIVLLNERVTLWDVAWKYTIRDFFLGCAVLIPATIGIGVRMLVYKLALKSCGRGFLMKHFVTIKFPERVTIGDHVGVSEYTLIDGDGGVSIGNYVRIASHVSIIAFNHNFSDPTKPIKLQGKTSKGIIIEDDCWLGTGVTVLDNVTIGKGSVVGAGSVVTKSIPPYSVAVGVPAKIIKLRS